MVDNGTTAPDPVTAAAHYSRLKHLLGGRCSSPLWGGKLCGYIDNRRGSGYLSGGGGPSGIVTIFSMPRLERSDGTHLRIGPGGGEMTMVTTWENRFELFTFTFTF